ncbi:MAG TPA: helix-hairpin-helix domain-containing protein [Pirellulales bacterium]|nr:helix-hairpin-helix domain-containing protein [Pirellulales bacterium]
MQPPPEPPRHATPPWLLKRADQAAVGGLVLVALVAMAAWWLRQGGWQGRLIEIDRQPKLEARFVVDINRADWPELAQLPGIGRTLAQRIVASRDEQGPFVDHDELRRVRGIGPKTLEKMRPYLRPIPSAASVASGGR